MENRGKRQSASIFGGMGFYIALLVCVVAAGVVGYFALLSPVQEPPLQSESITQPLPDPLPAAPVSGGEDEAIRQVLSDQPVAAEQAPSAQEDDPPASQSVVMVQADAPPVTAAAPSDTVRNTVAPLTGELAAAFSVSRLVYDKTLGDWRTHAGIDIRGEEGEAVLAWSGGTVISVGQDSSLGTTVVIDHGEGLTATYACLQEDVKVLAGDRVDPGSVIGAVGSTSLSEAALGPHLHFSLTKDGKPVDPADYLE